MNSHVIRSLLWGVSAEPIAIEPVHPNWQGSDAVASWKPDLLIIHYSCLDESGRPLNLLRFLRYMLLSSENTKVIVYSRTSARRGDPNARTELNRAIDRLSSTYQGRVFGLPIYRYRNRAQTFSDPETAVDLQKLVKRVLAHKA
jgi:hypothetical protein